MRKSTLCAPKKTTMYVVWCLLRQVGFSGYKWSTRCLDARVDGTGSCQPVHHKRPQKMCMLARPLGLRRRKPQQRFKHMRLKTSIFNEYINYTSRHRPRQTSYNICCSPKEQRKNIRVALTILSAASPFGATAERSLQAVFRKTSEATPTRHIYSRGQPNPKTKKNSLSHLATQTHDR